jgi:hypothetical protein
MKEGAKDIGKGDIGGGAVKVAKGVASGVYGGGGTAEAAGGKLGEFVDKKFISGDWDARNKANEGRSGIDAETNQRMDQSFKTQGKINDQRFTDAQAGRDAMNANDEAYGKRVSDLMSEAKNSSTDASIVYNRLGSEYSQQQERANREAESAMSLGDYMNQNNAVNQQTRGIYNDEANLQRGQFDAEAERQRGQYNDEGVYQQQFYDKQATGETRRGQADFGVLSALGAQAAGNTMGPMTVGQQMALMAQNQRQAGEAYANTQRRVQNLRDQGLQANLGNRNKGLDTATSTRGRGLDRATGLRERGIDTGFQRSDAAFAAGQDALNRQRAITGDRRGLEGEFRDFQMRNRGEREGFSQNLLGSEQSVANRNLSVANLRTGMDYEMERAKVAEQLRRAGVSEQRIDQQLAQMQGDTAARQAVAGGVVSAVGSAVGGYFGGPQGAQAGSQAGRAVPQGGGASTAGSGQSPYAQSAGFQGQQNTQGPTYQGSGFRQPTQPSYNEGSGQMGGAFGQWLQNKYGGSSNLNA